MHLIPALVRAPLSMNPVLPGKILESLIRFIPRRKERSAIRQHKETGGMLWNLAASDRSQRAPLPQTRLDSGGGCIMRCGFFTTPACFVTIWRSSRELQPKLKAQVIAWTSTRIRWRSSANALGSSPRPNTLKQPVWLFPVVISGRKIARYTEYAVCLAPPLNTAQTGTADPFVQTRTTFAPQTIRQSRQDSTRILCRLAAITAGTTNPTNARFFASSEANDVSELIPFQYRIPWNVASGWT
ncbi:hypothetical protein MYCTH_2113862 [Thermothelomyces thermophilus ATCC 42464]|uniref:Uncharacterized protein n=1 Tax=Thermothelomyces thermophilus (strain ATCC 42464 / BCRC 31852 / DSM 1799) TaxID=573729 RepID=G2QNB6_THET4|nr:uncharacterized protein MYCTH_2113862 [Thermothelomyces thermophilus ATCC 42464]AEO61989.1 hypothetical protein MYCTH_2113862 [Thermothelomyces thermophilus ATCC 42464]